MTINRTTHNLGAGHLLFGSALSKTLYCTAIRAEIATSWLEHRPGGFGRIGRVKIDETIKLTCSPIGDWSADIAAFLWPYGSTAIGAGIFGATDSAVAVQTIAGKRLSLHAAAITRMPTIFLGGSRPIYGDFEITGIVKNNTARSTADSVYTVATQAWAGLPAAANVVTLPLTSAVWGLGTPESVTARDGWTIDFELALTPQTAADVGTYDILFGGLEVRARCQPIGFADARIDDLKIQGAGNDIGSGARVEADLTLIQPNPGATITIENASLDQANPQYEDLAHRFPEVVWIARRDIATAYGAIFAVAQTAAA
jgi:hypothetical protein